MIGSAIFVFVLAVVLLVLTLWMVVRIWKRSPVLAVLTFVFSPLAIVALIVCWGDEESDIRMPFFLTVLVTALMIFAAVGMVEDGVHEMAGGLSDEDIAQIRESDPDLADALEAERDAQWSQIEADEAELEGRSGTTGESAPSASGEAWPEGDAAAPKSAPVVRDPAKVDAEFRADLARASTHLSWQFNRIAVPAAGTELVLPRHFRFAPRASLLQIARLRGAALPSDVLGWVVHRDVDLARDDAWFVQVRYVPLAAPLAPPQAWADAAQRSADEAAHVQRVASALGRQPESLRAMQWDATGTIAAWQEGPETSAFADHVAARVLPNGIIESRVPALHAVHAELGTRAARLVAAGVGVSREAATAR